MQSIEYELRDAKITAGPAGNISVNEICAIEQRNGSNDIVGLAFDAYHLGYIRGMRAGIKDTEKTAK